MSKGKKKNLINGEPCDHSGCRAHVSHPCEVAVELLAGQSMCLIQFITKHSG